MSSIRIYIDLSIVVRCFRMNPEHEKKQKQEAVEKSADQPEVLEMEAAESGLMTEEQITDLFENFGRFDSEQETDPGVLDVEFEGLSPEVQEKIEALEVEYQEAREAVDVEMAKSRLEIAQEAMIAAAEFFDLETKEKVIEALLEVIPYTGAVYALVGKRVKMEKGEGMVPKAVLEDISWTDRGLYLAGEVLISGHALRGVKDAFLKKGAKKMAVEIGKLAAGRTKDVLVTRATKKAKTKIGIDNE